jgi:hypothetical protein
VGRILFRAERNANGKFNCNDNNNGNCNGEPCGVEGAAG